MHVISKKALVAFWEIHPDSQDPLKAWYKIIRVTKYQGFNDLKATFGTMDYVEGKYVFNIGGNKYRLIAIIHFKYGRVYVRHVLTHKEYDKGDWKNG